MFCVCQCLTKGQTKLLCSYPATSPEERPFWAVGVIHILKCISQAFPYALGPNLLFLQCEGEHFIPHHPQGEPEDQMG